MPLGAQFPQVAPGAVPGYNYPYAPGGDPSNGGGSPYGPTTMTAGQGMPPAGGSTPVVYPNGTSPGGSDPSGGSGNIDWTSLIQGALGGITQGRNNANATDAQVAAQARIIAQQGGVLGNVQNLWSPQTATGGAAINTLGGALGLNSNGVIDPTAFESTPGFNFALQMGDQAINRNAAATGNAYSTTTMANLAKYNQGLATTTYQNYVDNLLKTAGLSTTANQSLTGANLTTGNNIAQALMNQGNASATGAYGKGGITQSLLQSPLVASLVKQFGPSVLKYFTGGAATSDAAGGILGGIDPTVLTGQDAGAYGALDATSGAAVGADSSTIGADTSSTISDWLNGGGFSAAGGAAATGGSSAVGNAAGAVGAAAGPLGDIYGIYGGVKQGGPLGYGKAGLDAYKLYNSASALTGGFGAGTAAGAYGALDAASTAAVGADSAAIGAETNSLLASQIAAEGGTAAETGAGAAAGADAAGAGVGTAGVLGGVGLAAGLVYLGVNSAAHQMDYSFTDPTTGQTVQGNNPAMADTLATVNGQSGAEQMVWNALIMNPNYQPSQTWINQNPQAWARIQQQFAALTPQQLADAQRYQNRNGGTGH